MSKEHRYRQLRWALESILVQFHLTLCTDLLQPPREAVALTIPVVPPSCPIQPGPSISQHLEFFKASWSQHTWCSDLDSLVASRPCTRWVSISTGLAHIACECRPDSQSSTLLFPVGGRKVMKGVYIEVSLILSYLAPRD